MTEKRFIMDNDSDITEFDYKQNEYIQDFMFANGKSWDKICNRLNELYEENEQLKSENKELQMRYDAQRQLYNQLNSDYNNLYGKRLKELYQL